MIIRVHGLNIHIFFSYAPGEYSASAIKSASVSWNTLIGCPGYLRWPNISTVLTLLWIIKFVLARNVTICCNRGRNKVNNRPALQEVAIQTTIPTKATTRITGRTTTTSENVSVSVSRRLSTQNNSQTQAQTQTQSQIQTRSHSQTTTRRQRDFGLDCGCGGECGHVSSSISGTKVAEDKTWVALAPTTATATRIAEPHTSRTTTRIHDWNVSDSVKTMLRLLSPFTYIFASTNISNLHEHIYDLPKMP